MNFKPKFTRTNKAVDTVESFDSVTKYMATNLIVFKRDSDILEVINTLNERKISGAPVLDDNNRVIGMIDEKDCMKVLIDAAYHNLPMRTKKVSDYMSTIFKTISPNQDIIQVANEFINSQYKRFCIVDHDNKLIGQISRSDVLKAVKRLS